MTQERLTESELRELLDTTDEKLEEVVNFVKDRLEDPAHRYDVLVVCFGKFQAQINTFLPGFFEDVSRLVKILVKSYKKKITQKEETKENKENK